MNVCYILNTVTKPLLHKRDGYQLEDGYHKLEVYESIRQVNKRKMGMCFNEEIMRFKETHSSGTELGSRYSKKTS